MLCHTQYTHILAWNGQWSSTASVVCFCALPLPPTSRVQPLEGDWEPPCTESFSALMCSLKERCESHHSSRNFVDSSTNRSVSLILIVGFSRLCVGVQLNVQLNIYGLQTWTHCSLPIPVLHLLPAVDVFLWCQGSAHENRTPDHPQKSALKMYMAIKDGSWLILSLKHVSPRTPPASWDVFWVEFISVFPIRARIRGSLRYSDTKTGSLPLSPILCRSRIIPYCQVVSLAFSKSKKTYHLLLPCKSITDVPFQTY